MANALLVVDVQNYYLDEIDDLPKRINRHIESVKYDIIAFSTFQNKEESNFVKSLKWEKLFNGTDAELPQLFAKIATTQNTFKRAAYSAFKYTKLNDYLKKHEVERLVLCGVDTDACVLATAFEAFDLGYHVKIDFDLTYSTGGLKDAAQKIAERSLISRD